MSMDVSKKVRGYLKELGITFNLTGYSYILDAMDYIYNNPQVLRKGVTSVLYPTIAAKYGEKSTCIERCIKHAIVIALDNLSPKISEKYFASAINYETGTVTNAQFLACLYTKLLDDESETDVTVLAAKLAAKRLDDVMTELEKE